MDNLVGCLDAVIGALIMTHSDDDGLVLHPLLAPSLIVILPTSLGQKDEEVRIFSRTIADALKKTKVSRTRSPCVKIDERFMSGGEKAWYWYKKGVPLHIELVLGSWKKHVGACVTAKEAILKKLSYRTKKGALWSLRGWNRYTKLYGNGLWSFAPKTAANLALKNEFKRFSPKETMDIIRRLDLPTLFLRKMKL